MCSFSSNSDAVSFSLTFYYSVESKELIYELNGLYILNVNMMWFG